MKTKELTSKMAPTMVVPVFRALGNTMPLSASNLFLKAKANNQII